MARNRSLDDFIDAESGSDTDGDPETERESVPDPESDADADTASDSPDESSESTLASGLDAGPATTTMSWEPDGAACEACDTVVERRWRDDDALVCDGCKEW